MGCCCSSQLKDEPLVPKPEKQEDNYSTIKPEDVKYHNPTKTLIIKHNNDPMASSSIHDLGNDSGQETMDQIDEEEAKIYGNNDGDKKSNAQTIVQTKNEIESDNNHDKQGSF